MTNLNTFTWWSFLLNKMMVNYILYSLFLTTVTCQLTSVWLTLQHFQCTHGIRNYRESLGHQYWCVHSRTLTCITDTFEHLQDFSISLSYFCGFVLCWRHTVPKLTPDDHTNMGFLISYEDGSWAIHEAEASTMPTEGLRMVPEPHTKATRRCKYFFSSLPARHTKGYEGHMMATRRRIERNDAFYLGHEGVTWPLDGIKPSASHGENLYIYISTVFQLFQLYNATTQVRERQREKGEEMQERYYPRAVPRAVPRGVEVSSPVSSTVPRISRDSSWAAFIFTFPTLPPCRQPRSSDDKGKYPVNIVVLGQYRTGTKAIARMVLV